MRCVAPLQCGHICLLHNGSYLYDRPYDISRDLICTAGRTCMRTRISIYQRFRNTGSQSNSYLNYITASIVQMDMTITIIGPHLLSSRTTVPA